MTGLNAVQFFYVSTSFFVVAIFTDQQSTFRVRALGCHISKVLTGGAFCLINFIFGSRIVLQIIQVEELFLKVLQMPVILILCSFINMEFLFEFFSQIICIIVFNFIGSFLLISAGKSSLLRLRGRIVCWLLLSCGLWCSLRYRTIHFIFLETLFLFKLIYTYYLIAY